ncbi:hypothetical protein DRE_05407 [Drechslerella stenobrocha 248]|uniref:J domain-containing protein n=1 Tax=Drechslerella stenobrocha 248 TaxID=1043628 RepID=W7HQW2_9PEZI|nr:hypothetical protein DRE_05407 [Drechslerella stenobrocha 248]
MYLAKPSATILSRCALLAARGCGSAFPICPQPCPQTRRRRHYATSSASTPDDWPTRKPLSKLTPYDIFNQSPSSAYCKTAFYRLVKLYHPDALPPANHPTASLSKVDRTERFRLIVAANTLLADPARKRAYDRYGIGWGWGKNGDTAHAYRYPHDRRTTADVYASGPWKHSPAANATWEDWERWYRAEGMGTGSAGGDGDDPDATTPLTTRANFVTLVLLLSFAGVLVQLARADSYNSNFVDRRDKRHRSISSDLMRARHGGGTISGKDERVQAFLRMRSPDAFGGVEAVREERMRRLLPDGEVCLSGNTKGSDTS